MKPRLAEGLVDALRGAGIDCITYLPETRLSAIIPLLQSDASIQMVPAKRREFPSRRARRLEEK